VNGQSRITELENFQATLQLLVQHRNIILRDLGLKQTELPS
jgi:hypothetical protein